jgi:hypothetical protein
MPSAYPKSHYNSYTALVEKHERKNLRQLSADGTIILK